MIYTENTTIDDVLAAWDSGDTIWSVEMGGIGPGYEQAIQILAIGCMREFKVLDWTQNKPDGWEAARDRAYARTEGGYSGAQVGAATSIAAKFCREGPKAALDSAEEDRRIQVSKHFPVAP